MASEQLLEQLVLRGLVAELKYHLDRDPSLARQSTLGGFGYSLLHKACAVGANEGVIPLLLAAGLDVNQVTTFGSTPLTKARALGAKGTRICELLIQAGGREMLATTDGVAKTPSQRQLTEVGAVVLHVLPTKQEGKPLPPVNPSYDGEAPPSYQPEGSSRPPRSDYKNLDDDAPPPFGTLDFGAFGQEEALREGAILVEEKADGKNQKHPQKEGGKKEKKQKYQKAPGCWESWKQSPHLLGLFFTLAVIIWLSLEFGCLGQYSSGPDISTLCGDSVPPDTNMPDTTGWCQFCYKVGLEPWGWVIFAILYVIYIFHSLFCRAAQYLMKVKTLELCYDHYLTALSHTPGVQWNIVCYHYETRTRTYTDANNNLQTETYQERVNTHWANMMFQFNVWTDISENLPPDVEISRLRFDHSFALADDYTSQCYNTEMITFKAENNRDTHQDFSMAYQVLRLKPSLVFNNIKLPKLMRYAYYFFFSVIFLSFPFRVWVSSISAKGRVQMVKSLKRLPPMSIAIPVAMPIVEGVAVGVVGK